LEEKKMMKHKYLTRDRGGDFILGISYYDGKKKIEFHQFFMDHCLSVGLIEELIWVKETEGEIEYKKLIFKLISLYCELLVKETENLIVH